MWIFPWINKIYGLYHLLNCPQFVNCVDCTVANAPTVSPSTTNNDLVALFLKHPKLHSVAVVDGSRPLGIINRINFMNEYSKLYYREIAGRKPCVIHANLEPRLIERNHNVDELIGILTSDDQRYLTDGFIVTENARYADLNNFKPFNDQYGYWRGENSRRQICQRRAGCLRRCACQARGQEQQARLAGPVEAAPKQPVGSEVGRF
jgi:hypothetical protein